LALKLMEEHFDASLMNLAAKAQDSGARATKK
jgi:hypothetical protein